MTDDEKFEYSSDMKEFYKSDEVAEEYHDAFSDGGSLRHRIVADRERKTVESFLQQVPNDTVLDIPTGTGKLAPIFSRCESSVLACDISENMLRIAEEEYERAGVTDARFQVCDAEEITETVDEHFDVTVSLRLLHRVPPEVKENILSELGAVSDYVIASTGIETRFHEFRRTMRQRVLGGDQRDHCYESAADTEAIFSEGFEIVASKRVLPVLSQEWIFLLRPTN